MNTFRNRLRNLFGNPVCKHEGKTTLQSWKFVTKPQRCVIAQQFCHNCGQVFQQTYIPEAFLAFRELYPDKNEDLKKYKYMEARMILKELYLELGRLNRLDKYGDALATAISVLKCELNKEMGDATV